MRSPAYLDSVCRWAVAATLAMAMCVSSGCTSFRDYVNNGFKVGPQYGTPAAPTAEDWINADDQRLRSDEDHLTDWWTVFNDPVLNQLVQESYEQNLTLRQAGFRILQARAIRGIAVGEFFPQQQDVFGGSSRNTVSKSNANTAFLYKKFFDQHHLGVGLSWEIDFWGRYRRAIEAADADLDASIENFDDVLVTLIGDVAAAYVEIRTLQRRIELAKVNATLQAETLKIAEARFNGGLVTELDVDQARSNLAQTRAIVPRLEIGLRIATNRLCVLMGRPPEDLLPRLGEGAIPVAPPTVAVGVPAQLLSRRPDVRLAERRVASQSALVGVATAELYPHIGINGSIGYSAEKLGSLFESPALQGNAGPAFQWNVLNYGRLINNIRRHDAKLEELITAYQQTVLTAHSEVEGGLVQFLKGQERVSELGDSVDASEKAVKIAIANYEQGRLIFTAVAFVQKNLVDQQELMVQAQGDVALGLIEAYRALGGGWQIREQEPDEMVDDEAP